MVLEYLEVLLSAPPLFSIVAIVVICRFNREVRDLLSRVATIKLPGGAEFAMQQSRIGVDDESAAPADADDIAVQEINHLELTSDQQQRVEQLVRTQIATARRWEYRYLNYFLVRTTQLALDWLVGLTGPITYEDYDSCFLPIVPTARERQAMVAALAAHYLIEIDQESNSITLTPKGREYHEWRGALTPLPPAPTEPYRDSSSPASLMQ